MERRLLLHELDHGGLDLLKSSTAVSFIPVMRAKEHRAPRRS